MEGGWTKSTARCAGGAGVSMLKIQDVRRGGEGPGKSGEL